jgi:hypothetical protein
MKVIHARLELATSSLHNRGLFSPYRKMTPKATDTVIANMLKTRRKPPTLSIILMTGFQRWGKGSA